MPGVVTELRPLGAFATWQAERAVGDHDRNTLRLRLDPQGDASGLEPGMTVWIARENDADDGVVMMANHKHDNPILVTGAAGAVGASAATSPNSLLARKHKVRALVRREASAPKPYGGSAQRS